MTMTQDAILAIDGSGKTRAYSRWHIREHGKDLILWTRVASVERVISVGPRGRTVQLNSEDQEEIAALLLFDQQRAPVPADLVEVFRGSAISERRPRSVQLQPTGRAVKHGASAGQ